MKLELTKNQERTRDMLKLLVAGIQGALFPSTQAMAIYKQFRKKAIYPVARYKGPLEFGPNYSIEVCMYSKTKEERLPSLKKFSSAVPFSTDAKEGLVKMSRECALEDDPTNTVVEPEDIIKAYYYGTSVVPVSPAEEDLLKFATGKCLKLLGFVSREDVHREWYMEGVEMLLPAVTDADQKAFKAIAQAMFNRNEVALVRYVYRDNSPPRLAVLTPHIKKSLICMYLNYLPCAEDIREYSFAPLPESTAEQQAAADELIDALSLEFTDEDGEKIEALQPSRTFNPALQYLYQCLTHRMDNPDGQLPPLDPNIEEYLKPDDELFARAKAKCDKFASKFVLKEVAQPKAQKKFYSEALRDEEAAAAHKPGDIPMGEAADQISELDPEADFVRFLKDRTVDRVNQAIAQMQDIITRLVEHSFRGNTFDKALSCLRCLRQGCLDEDETGQFNAFMQMKVKEMQKTQPDFWVRLVDSGISLISKAESDNSLVEPAEAAAFLVKTAKPASQKPVDDDLLADIE